MMAAQIFHSCDQHPDRFDCPDALIHFWPAGKRWIFEYGLIIHDGGRSKILIQYCPWCGKRLGK